MVRIFSHRKASTKRKRKLKTKGKPSRREAPVAKATILGEIKYPWGVVAHGTIMMGDKSTVADANGRFEIQAVDAGTYSISVNAPFPGYAATPQSVTVAAGETKTVNLYLDFEKSVVEGHIYDTDGNPIAGATLSGIQFGKDMESASTDDKGYFRFDRARPGNQFIRVNAPGYQGETRDFTAKKDGTTTIDFRLTRATLKVHGTVTDSTGKPLKAEVHLSKAGVIVQKVSTVSETGQYEFSVLPGVYGLLANAPGYISNGWGGETKGDTKVDFKLNTLSPVTLKK